MSCYYPDALFVDVDIFVVEPASTPSRPKKDVVNSSQKKTRSVVKTNEDVKHVKPTPHVKPTTGRSTNRGRPVTERKPEIKLHEEHLGVVPVYKSFAPLHNGAKFFIARGSVVKFEGDCVVNAANETCLGGGGLDGAITNAGGEKLRDARESLAILPGGVRCPTGSSRMTVGGDLSARFVAHAVGPMYARMSEDEGDRLLASAYESTLKLCDEYNIKTIAFPPLSGGIFRGRKSLEEVINIGLRTLYDKTPEGVEEVYLVGFDDEEVKKMIKVAKAFFY